MTIPKRGGEIDDRPWNVPSSAESLGVLPNSAPPNPKLESEEAQTERGRQDRDYLIRMHLDELAKVSSALPPEHALFLCDHADPAGRELVKGAYHLTEEDLRAGEVPFLLARATPASVVEMGMPDAIKLGARVSPLVPPEVERIGREGGLAVFVVAAGGVSFRTVAPDGQLLPEFVTRTTPITREERLLRVSDLAERMKRVILASKRPVDADTILSVIEHPETGDPEMRIFMERELGTTYGPETIDRVRKTDRKGTTLLLVTLRDGGTFVLGIPDLPTVATRSTTRRTVPS